LLSLSVLLSVAMVPSFDLTCSSSLATLSPSVLTWGEGS
jgi:hypothetical protein